MTVKFSEYRFLRDQLILYKHEKIIPLKHTQALLLDYFLANPNGIHSKEAIMDAVWKDKVVSEQVVFQTISQLRSLFGADAIKTFSKKGYQWQLDLCQESGSSEKTTSSELTTNSEQLAVAIAVKEPQIVRKPYWPMIIVIVFIVIAIYLLQAFLTKEKPILHLVENTDSTSLNHKKLTDLTHLSKNKILQDGVFTVKLTPQNSSTRQSFSAPKLTWQQSNIPAQEWRLWTDTFNSSAGTFLSYGLSNGSVSWRGYVYAKTDEQLAEKLSERLIQLHQLGLFSRANSKLDISTLTSMSEIAPNDADILLLLAKHYLEVQQFDVAMTYAQKLANLAPSYGFSPYRAKAQWLMAEVHSKRHKYQLASNALNNMSTTLAGTPLWPLNYENIKARAWLAYRQHDFDAMFTLLEQGIDFGRNQADVLTLFELHILYSILAKKGGDDHKKYAHLNEAQALLLKHKLDESNFAVVYYHFAIFSQDTSNAVPYFEKILKLPRAANNGWIIDHSTELLIDQYIKQQDFELALSLLSEQEGSAKYMLSMARIYHAQQAPKKARSHFEKAFELARLQYKTHIGIDSALMLFQLSAEQVEIQAEYLDYLKRNANEEWLNEQLKKLESNALN